MDGDEVVLVARRHAGLAAAAAGGGEDGERERGEMCQIGRASCRERVYCTV